ncbi:MAG: hypothetical protein IKE64_07330 [Thermoguttaceae bacterium]|nr:hypothetical protein [Thermoguttaceae bacterium]
MKRSYRVLFGLAALLILSLPLICGCASTKNSSRPIETVDDFMMQSKPENPNAKY